MNKYIDADLLRKEIERRYAYQKEMYNKTKPDGRPNDGWAESLAIMGELEELRTFLDSLQQEQESIAERFARIVRGNLIGIDKEVQQKFEQLYFEVTGNKMYRGYND